MTFHDNRRARMSLSARVCLALLLTTTLSAPTLAQVSIDQCETAVTYQGPALRAALPAEIFPTDRNFATHAMAAKNADILFQAFAGLMEKTDASAGAIAIWNHKTGFWSSKHGLSDGATDVFWWASVGKMVTGAIIAQLTAEGALTLDDTIDAWFPNHPGGDRITVENLLTHTSGVFSFNADKKLNKQRGYISPDTLMKAATRHPYDFCPGSNWNYSNSGYLLLALIAERTTGQSYAELVNQRIATPLGLASVRIVQRGDPEGSLVAPNDEAHTTIDELASISGAGAVAGNTKDMLAFLHAFLTGDVISVAARDKAYETLYPMFGGPMSYGRAVMVFDVPDAAAPTIWLGHAGGAPGGKALLIYDVERETYLALALNRQAPAEAIANSLLKLMDSHPDQD